MTALANDKSSLELALQGLDQVAGPTTGVEGTTWKACCPVHDDSNPSLSITETASGTVLVHCFAGCSTRDVRKALGLTSHTTGGDWMPGGIRHEATYDYTDIGGTPLFQVLRGVMNGKKQIRQRVPDPSASTGYTWSLKGLSEEQRQQLYLLPAVATAIEDGEPVYLVEGEKDVHSALAIGCIATTNAGGAGKFTARHANQLKGADVRIVQDKDDAGRRHGSLAFDLLDGVAASVRLYDVHESLAEKSDLTDHLDAGFGLDDLVEVEPTETAGAVIMLPGVAEWTESGVSERFVEDAKGSWTWITGLKWHRWNGRIWEMQEDDSTLLEACRQFANGEVRRVLETGGPVGEAVKFLSKSRVASVATLAKGQLPASIVEFDTDPDIFVAGDCVIDLRTSTSLPHNPKRLVTKASPVNFRPGASHPDWEAALTAIDPEVAEWLQIRLGQAMTGYVPDDDVMPVLKGGGENGKSTVLGAVLAVLGTYAMVLPTELLLGNPNDHPTKKMCLKGLRLGVQEETPEGRRLDMIQVKQILGTPSITGHYMRQDDVTFRSTHALVISTNPELTVEETDHASWRRLAKVDFHYTYKKPGQTLETPTDRPGDPGLRDRLKEGQEQREAVLAWLVEGAGRWYANGRQMPPPPQQVVEATERWRKKSDQWLAYAGDHVVIDDGWAIWIEDLHKHFNEFLRGRSQRNWGPNLFRGRLEENQWLQQPGVSLTGRERLSTLSKRLGVDIQLSRPVSTEALKPAPAQGQYLVGVRFRTVEDDAADLAAEGASDTPEPQPAPSGGTPTTPKRDRPSEPGRVMPVITDMDEVA